MAPNSNSINMAPKLRFKQRQRNAVSDSGTPTPEGPKSSKEDEARSKGSSPSNPFRPWDLEKKDDQVAVEAAAASWMLRNQLALHLTSLQQQQPLLKLADQSLLIAPPKSPAPVQDEPLSLVKHNRNGDTPSPKKSAAVSPEIAGPSHWSMTTEAELLRQLQNSLRSSAPLSSTSASPPAEDPKDVGKPKQRNYKNMTRERRIEANARERQRVHTITAAFEKLQTCIHANEAGQKLSKLSIIKIATSYIMVLSRACGYDYSEDQSKPSLETCLKTYRDQLAAESKVRKCWFVSLTSNYWNLMNLQWQCESESVKRKFLAKPIIDDHL